MGPDPRLLAPLALVCAAYGCKPAADAPPSPATARPALGLMSSLPIYWAESGDVAATLAGGGRPGWVRGALEEHYALEPLDTLEAPRLAGVDALLLAQPRPLAPAENVALDAWVRKGGRLLLFADPMLTTPSRFPLGDKRRPQDVALLSPILRHWGLELQFDEAQPAGERPADAAGVAVPVALAGRFSLLPGSGCAIAGEVLAECRLGKGRVVVLADAALLDEPDGGDSGPRRAALAALLARAFD